MPTSTGRVFAININSTDGSWLEGSYRLVRAVSGVRRVRKAVARVRCLGSSNSDWCQKHAAVLKYSG